MTTDPKNPKGAEETRKDWEVVQEDVGQSKTDRLRIQGGSLVRTTIYGGGAATAVAMVYVPN